MSVPRDSDALHCPNCDYNLTGLPEDRCPECGAVFDRAALLHARFMRWHRRAKWANSGPQLAALVFWLIAPASIFVLPGPCWVGDIRQLAIMALSCCALAAASCERERGCEPSAGELALHCGFVILIAAFLALLQVAWALVFFYVVVPIFE